MPHIILETSPGLKNRFAGAEALKAMHAFIGAEESVDITRIKSRLYTAETVYVGDSDMPDEMIHITLKILPGRDDAILRAMTQGLQVIASEKLQGASPVKISAEAVLLHKESYVA